MEKILSGCIHKYYRQLFKMKIDVPSLPALQRFVLFLTRNLTAHFGGFIIFRINLHKDNE